MTQVFNIGELFARDPRKFTDEEFLTVVNECRAARAKFVLGPTAAPAKASTKKALPSTKLLPGAGSVDL